MPLLFLLISLSVQAEVLVERGPKTGLLAWEWRHQGISLRLIQRLPDQTRAYTMARGFDRQQADELARNCFFGSMFRNDGNRPLDFDLNDWRIIINGEEKKLKTREYWQQRWQGRVSTEAWVGLHWSLLPTQQHFEPGDYNWGMTVYGLPPGSLFDLRLVLQYGDERIEALIPLMQCAEDH